MKSQAALALQQPYRHFSDLANKVAAFLAVTMLEIFSDFLNVAGKHCSSRFGSSCQCQLIALVPNPKGSRGMGRGSFIQGARQCRAASEFVGNRVDVDTITSTPKTMRSVREFRIQLPRFAMEKVSDRSMRSHSKNPRRRDCQTCPFAI